jgi:hypothetical protein
METNCCPRCGEVKSLTEFVGKRKTYCRPCWNAIAKAWRDGNPEKRRETRRTAYEREDPARRNAAARRRRWGLSEDDIAGYLDRQGGRCAICPTTEPGGRGGWHVDHDHACCPRGRSCGRCIRGLLCTRCNVGLGQFRDDPNLLANAIKYLTSS